MPITPTANISGAAENILCIQAMAPTAVTKADETVTHAGVRVAGPTNLPAAMPNHASQMYSKTIQNLLEEFLVEGEFNLNLEDDILAAAVVTHGGAVVNERVRSSLATA